MRRTDWRREGISLSPTLLHTFRGTLKEGALDPSARPSNALEFANRREKRKFRNEQRKGKVEDPVSTLQNPATVAKKDARPKPLSPSTSQESSTTGVHASESVQPLRLTKEGRFIWKKLTLEDILAKADSDQVFDRLGTSHEGSTDGGHAGDSVRAHQATSDRPLGSEHVIRKRVEFLEEDDTLPIAALEFLRRKKAA